MATAFCSNCGAQRAPDAKFCGSCGRPFESAPEGFTTDQARTLTTVAGVAWIIAAAATGYLALQQWQAAGLLKSIVGDDNGFTSYAVFNALAAALTVYFGARLLTSPTRGILTSSVWWALLSVLGAVVQTGTGNEAFRQD